MIDSFFIELLYVIAQIPLFARMWVQTKQSLVEERSVNPSLFWILTIIGSLLVIVYGLLIGSWAVPLMSAFSIGYSFFHWNIEKKRK